MTSSNVKSTCERHNFVTTCVGSSRCSNSDSNCTATALTTCGHPMSDLKKVCEGRDIRLCPKMNGTFVYMGGRKSAWGVVNGVTPVIGSNYFDQWALCASTNQFFMALMTI